MNPFKRERNVFERIARASTLLLVLAAAAFLARHIWTVFSAPTIDDAAISYSYASNLAEGHGLRNTPGASPAEGFSNPLEVLLLGGFAFFHTDLDTAAKGINLAFLLAGLAGWGFLIAWRARGIGRFFAPLLCLLPLLWPTFNYWTVAGLENGILAGLLSLSVLCLLLSSEARGWDIGLGIVAGLLEMARLFCMFRQPRYSLECRPAWRAPSHLRARVDRQVRRPHPAQLRHRRAARLPRLWRLGPRLRTIILQDLPRAICGRLEL